MIILDKSTTQIIRDMPNSDIKLSLIRRDEISFYEYKISFVVDQILAYQTDVRAADITIFYKSIKQEFNTLSKISDKRPNKINLQIQNIAKNRVEFSKKISEEKIKNAIYTTSFDLMSRSPKISAFRRKQVGFIDLVGNNPSLTRQFTNVEHTFRIPTNNAPATGIIIVNVVIKNQTDYLIQERSFEINHNSFVAKYNIPNILPSAYTSPNAKDSIRLNSFVTDDRIQGVSVYTRRVNNSLADINQANFVRIYTENIDSTRRYGSALLRQNSKAPYEVRAVAELKSGIQLGNIVSSTRSEKKSETISGLIFCVANQGYVEVSIRNIDPKYRYVQILRKDAASLHSDWQKIGNITPFTGTNFTITDTSVRSNRVYIYTAICQEKFGNTRFISTIFAVRTTYYTPGVQVAVASSTETLQNGTFRRTLDVTIALDQKSNITLLLNSFKEQGIDVYYDEELKKLSGNLDEIFKVAVKRVDIERNEIVDLGIKSIGKIIDTSDSNVVYIVEALYRNQADLLEEIGVDSSENNLLDPRSILNQGVIVSNTLTGKQLKDKNNFTQKFLSNKSFLRGTLSYGATRSSGADTRGFLDGRLGVAATVEFSNIQSDPIIQNARITQSLNRQTLLTFNIVQTRQVQNINFFEIYRTVTNNVEERIFLGRCHYNTGTNRLYFLDQIPVTIQTGVVYEIKPFKLDGTPLPAFTTTTLRPE
jgi:hypothetical protein